MDRLERFLKYGVAIRFALLLIFAFTLIFGFSNLDKANAQKLIKDCQEAGLYKFRHI